MQRRVRRQVWEHPCEGEFPRRTGSGQMKTEDGILMTPMSARTAGRAVYQADEKELLEEKEDSELKFRGSVVKTTCFHCRGHESDPCSGN